MPVEYSQKNENSFVAHISVEFPRYWLLLIKDKIIWILSRGFFPGFLLMNIVHYYANTLFYKKERRYLAKKFQESHDFSTFLRNATF